MVEGQVTQVLKLNSLYSFDTLNYNSFGFDEIKVIVIFTPNVYVLDLVVQETSWPGFFSSQLN